jgi:hypothetical protein
MEIEVLEIYDHQYLCYPHIHRASPLRINHSTTSSISIKIILSSQFESTLIKRHMKLKSINLLFFAIS